MSDEKTNNSVITSLVSEFGSLLASHTEEAEKRARARTEKLDEKLEKLIDTLNKNTLALQTTQENQRHHWDRMERLEVNQQESGKERRALAEQVIIITERLSKNTGTIERWASAINTLMILGIGAWLGLK